jgi:hypothetical protein
VELCIVLEAGAGDAAVEVDGATACPVGREGTAGFVAPPKVTPELTGVPDGKPPSEVPPVFAPGNNPASCEGLYAKSID